VIRSAIECCCLKNKPLKSKLYREDKLTLTKLIDIVRTYHDKEALILVPSDNKTVNFVKAGINPRDQKSKNKLRGKVHCYRCGQVRHLARDCTSAETGTDKSAKDGSTIKCFRCDRSGHRASVSCQMGGLCPQGQGEWSWS
jgi:hypothetical protein